MENGIGIIGIKIALLQQQQLPQHPPPQLLHPPLQLSLAQILMISMDL